MSGAAKARISKKKQTGVNMSKQEDAFDGAVETLQGEAPGDTAADRARVWEEQLIAPKQIYRQNLRPLFQALAKLPAKKGMGFVVKEEPAMKEPGGNGPEVEVSYENLKTGEREAPKFSVTVDPYDGWFPKWREAPVTYYVIRDRPGHVEEFNSLKKAGKAFAEWVNENAPERAEEVKAVLQKAALTLKA